MIHDVHIHWTLRCARDCWGKCRNDTWLEHNLWNRIIWRIQHHQNTRECHLHLLKMDTKLLQVNNWHLFILTRISGNSFIRFCHIPGSFIATQISYVKSFHYVSHRFATFRVAIFVRIVLLYTFRYAGTFQLVLQRAFHWANLGEKQISAMWLVSEKIRREKVESVPTFLLVASLCTISFT